MKKVFTVCAGLLFLMCSLSYAVVPQESVGGIAYENRTIGIKVTLPEKWELYTEGAKAPDQFKHLFEKKKGENESFLFLGNSPNKQVFCRLLSEVYGGSAIDYFDLLYAAQRDKVGIISAKYDELDDTVQWVFSTKIGQMDITFQETITKSGNYVVRLGFWTYAPLFAKYRSTFDAVAGATCFLGGKDGREICVNVWEDLPKNLGDKNLAYVETTKKTTAAGGPVECKDGKKSVLWEVKGKKNAVYLFGSIHLGRPEFYPFEEKVESSFDKSKYLVVEFDAASKESERKTSEYLGKARLEGGKSLQDVLSPGVYKKLTEQVDKIGLPMDGFRNLKPWMVAASLEVLKMQSMGYMPDYGVDRYFLDRARDRKKIMELESFEEQVGLFDNIGEEKFLAYTLFSLDSLETSAEKLMKAWRCGDLKTLERITFEDDKPNVLVDSDAIYNKLYYDRNNKMTAKIREYLSGEGDYFVVVGAAHLIGNKGIVSLLSNEGYSVNRL